MSEILFLPRVYLMYKGVILSAFGQKTFEARITIILFLYIIIHQTVYNEYCYYISDIRGSRVPELCPLHRLIRNNLVRAYLMYKEGSMAFKWNGIRKVLQFLDL